VPNTWGRAPPLGQVCAQTCPSPMRRQGMDGPLACGLSFEDWKRARRLLRPQEFVFSCWSSEDGSFKRLTDLEVTVLVILPLFN
jgi:hypothetical protein